MSTAATLLWLVVSLVLLIPCTRWLGRHLQGLVLLLTQRPGVALYLYFCLLLPGTLVHELSHLLTARLLGVKTGRLTLGPRMQGDNRVQFGAVTYERPDVLRESLVGLAPLLVGSGLILLIALRGLGLDPRLIHTPADLPAQWRHLTQARDAWLWMYLIVALSNAMLPSAADRRGWAPVAIFLALLGIFLHITGALAHLPDPLMAWGAQAVRALALTFSLALLLDLLLGAALWLVESLLAYALQRRVQYS